MPSDSFSRRIFENIKRTYEDQKIISLAPFPTSTKRPYRSNPSPLASQVEAAAIRSAATQACVSSTAQVMSAWDIRSKPIRYHRRSGEAVNPVLAFRPRRASPRAEMFPQTAPGQRAGRTMVLSRKGRERALMGRRFGCSSGPSAPAGPAVRRAGKRRLGARPLPESRRRNSRGVCMARIPPHRSPWDRRRPRRHRR